MRELWSNFPIPLDFKIYLFNVTNPMEITAGEKPILEEVGPFFYEWVIYYDINDKIYEINTQSFVSFFFFLNLILSKPKIQYIILFSPIKIPGKYIWFANIYVFILKHLHYNIMRKENFYNSKNRSFQRIQTKGGSDRSRRRR